MEEFKYSINKIWKVKTISSQHTLLSHNRDCLLLYKISTSCFHETKLSEHVFHCYAWNFFCFVLTWTQSVLDRSFYLKSKIEQIIFETKIILSILDSGLKKVEGQITFVVNDPAPEIKERKCVVVCAVDKVHQVGYVTLC